jgi:hypothetical protein
MPSAPDLPRLLTVVEAICEVVPGRYSGIEQRANEFALPTLVSTNGLAGAAR